MYTHVNSLAPKRLNTAEIALNVLQLLLKHVNTGHLEPRTIDSNNSLGHSVPK